MKVYKKPEIKRKERKRYKYCLVIIFPTTINLKCQDALLEIKQQSQTMYNFECIRT